jgi:hypothetical protein
MSTAEAQVTVEEAPRRRLRRRSEKVPGMLLLTLFCLILMGIALGTLSTRDDAVPRSPHSAPSSAATVSE